MGERVLIFGGTGYMGKNLVKASIALGHKTYVYSRPQSVASKKDIYEQFTSMGVTIINGELDDKEKLEEGVKQVDVVLSALAFPQVFEQLKIIDALKTAPNVKRFVPSDFGLDHDRVRNPLPALEVYVGRKRQIREATKKAGIPYTFTATNCGAAYFINYLLHPSEPQIGDIKVYGTGEAQAILNYKEDIGMYTIKAATDPRTCNRTVTFRPSKNIISQFQLISNWEKKTNRTFEKKYIYEDQLAGMSKSLPIAEAIPISIIHNVFVKGEMMSFALGENDIEASEFYPDVKYTSVDKVLDIFLVDPPKPYFTSF